MTVIRDTVPFRRFRFGPVGVMSSIAVWLIMCVAITSATTPAIDPPSMHAAMHAALAPSVSASHRARVRADLEMGQAFHIIVAQPSGAFVPGTTIEVGRDRPGWDYADFDVDSPEECQKACLNDRDCLAFTVNQDNHCWLKNDVPDWVWNDCCTSGIRTETTGRGTTVEWGVDRPRSDYDRIELNRADPGLCQRKCLGDPKCRTFVYKAPGYEGKYSPPLCYLKASTPRAVGDECCVAGAKTR